MTAFALPSWFGADGFSLSLDTTQRSFASPFGGSEQVVDLGSDRWKATLSASPRTYDEAAALEALIAGMRGMTNTLAIHHLLRKQPRGTLRGAASTVNNAAAGAASIVVQAPVVGQTLLAGDMLGIGGLLLQVAADCVTNGVGNMTVPLVNRLRVAISNGTAVVWDRPTAPFRLASKPVVQFAPGYAQGVTMDFVEAIG
ncbi:MAG: hypothetical protein Q7T70_02570 [Polaromonas sp.]|nr:hypothetical protein [Polaromonas sp.]